MSESTSAWIPTANGERVLKAPPPGFDILAIPTVEIHGGRLPLSGPVEELTEHIEAIRNMEMRDGDVMVAAFPKCGTHWIWEVVHMLLRQSTTLDKRAKEQVMLDFGDVATLNALESPRVLNSHHFMSQLPQEMIEKQTKIIHVVRNPKDTVVSMFHHLKQMSDILTFKDLLINYMANEMHAQHQFDYLRQMQDFQDKHPNHPVQLVYYENMKKNPVETIKDLADFLGVPASEEYCHLVADACSFNKMKNFESQKDLTGALEEVMKNVEVFRKGTIGDWKNSFTVAQNEAFDEFIAKESDGLKFQFIYE